MEWKRIEGFYPYEVNRNGEVRNSNTGRILNKIRASKCKCICVRMKGTFKSVNKVVYETFVGKIKKGYMAYNIDGDYQNNKLENIGIKKMGNPKKVIRIDEDGKETKYNSVIEAAKANYINYQSISSCLVGHIKTSAGYRWRYADTV